LGQSGLPSDGAVPACILRKPFVGQPVGTRLAFEAAEPALFKP
jgi:hypothetical protein